MKKLFTLMVLAMLAALTPAMADTWEVTYPVGATASSVDDVQIKCTETAFRYLAEDATAKLYKGETLVKTLVRDDITLSFKGSYCTVDFEFNPALTEVGDYRIDVPEAAFSTSDGAVNAAFSVNFSVAAAAYTVVDDTWTCVMPEGGSAASLEYIMLASAHTWDAVGAAPSGAIYNAAFAEVATLDGSNIFAYQGCVMVSLSTPITTPGSYALVLNEGAVVSTAAGVTNGMAMVELTVVAPEPDPEVTAMPADGSSVSADTGIQAIFLTVNGYKFVAANTEGISGSISKDGNSFATLAASTISMAMDHASAIINLPAEAQMNTAGEYVVYLPKGFFTMRESGSDSATTVDSPEITLHYTVTVPAEPLSWTISPAPGQVEKLDVVTITFNKPVQKALTSYVNLFYTNYSYLPETVSEGTMTVSEDGLTATITFQPECTIGGVFQLRLFEGEEQLKVVDGETFPGLNATYKVTAPLYTESDPEDGATVETIDQVKVLLRYNTQIAATDAFSAYFVDGEKRVEANLVKVVPYNFEPAYLVVQAAETITESGDWTLVIEEGSLTISNYGETMPSPAISVNIKTSGIVSVGGILIDCNQPVAVYSLQGRRIHSAATASELRSLAPGLYIIAGKKVLVK